MVGDTGLARSAPGLREHRRGRVDPEDGTCLPDLVDEVVDADVDGCGCCGPDDGC